MTFLLYPLYFVRSGGININIGRLWFSGVNGYIWPATASSKHVTGSPTPSASYFAFDESDTYPSYGPTIRLYGFPLRYLIKRNKKLERSYHRWSKR